MIEAYKRELKNQIQDCQYRVDALDREVRYRQERREEMANMKMKLESALARMERLEAQKAAEATREEEDDECDS